ncbi:MAG: glycosyltransferase family 4 protein [Candidatus Acidiferrales bacterium]
MEMTTETAELISISASKERTDKIRLCHFTTAHRQLKSRSFHRECLPLAAAGIAVRYVAPMEIRGRRDGVDFVALPEHASRARRLLAGPSLVRELLRQDASLYHFQDPELLPVAFALKLIFGKRVVYDTYEDFPSVAANKAAIPRALRPFAAAIVGAAEKLAARYFDGVMTADPLTLRRMARFGKSRKLVFYNFPNLDFFPAPEPRAKRFDVVYRGGLSERAGTFVVLDAMRLLAARLKPARLLLVGYFDDDAAEKQVRERVRELGLASSVVIRGRLEHEEMAKALGEARVGVCPLQPHPKFLKNIPVKIFEYWACGLPVVASDLPPIRPFFRNTSAGFLFRPGCAAELAASIGWLMDHPEAATRMGCAGRAAVVDRFNNDGEVRKLREFCARIVANS